MANDLEVIAKLEIRIGKKLLNLPRIVGIGRTNGFFMNAGGRVVELNLTGCNLTNISDLQSLTNLTVLHLGSNKLTDISALQPLTKLTKLWLYNNRLTDTRHLQSLTMLKELLLQNNQLTDILALQILKQLKVLDLRNNKIKRLPTFITQWEMDIKFIKEFPIYGINLYGNPLETL